MPTANTQSLNTLGSGHFFRLQEKFALALAYAQVRFLWGDLGTILARLLLIPPIESTVSII